MQECDVCGKEFPEDQLEDVFMMVCTEILCTDCLAQHEKQSEYFMYFYMVLMGGMFWGYHLYTKYYLEE